MDIIVNGTSYPSWDDVPQDLKVAIANSDPQPPPEPVATPLVVPELDDLDELVALAEAAERRRAQGLPPLEPVHLAPQTLPEPPTAPSPVFELNGRRYQSIKDVPGEIREALRRELLATPVPALEPRLPRALTKDRPEPPAAISNEGPVTGVASPPATAGPDPTAPKPPMISRGYKVAMAVMIAMVVAIYVAVYTLT